MDCGTCTQNAAFVIWNGPLGKRDSQPWKIADERKLIFNGCTEEETSKTSDSDIRRHGEKFTSDMDPIWIRYGGVLERKLVVRMKLQSHQAFSPLIFLVAFSQPTSRPAET